MKLLIATALEQLSLNVLAHVTNDSLVSAGDERGSPGCKSNALITAEVNFNLETIKTKK